MNQLLIAIIAAAVLTAGAGYKGYTIGKGSVQAEWDAEKIKVAAVNAKATSDRLAENEASRQKLSSDANKRSITREKEQFDVRATARRDAGKRVPIDAARVCISAGSTAPTIAGSGQQDTPGAAELPESLVRDLRQLAADADEVTADARAMREFIRASVAP